MQTRVMLPTEPADGEWFAIIIMMGIGPGMSADLTGLAHQISAFEATLHGKMGAILIGIGLTPLRLTRIRCQVQFGHGLFPFFVCEPPLHA